MLPSLPHSIRTIGVETVCEMGSSSSSMVNVATFEVSQITHVCHDFLSSLMLLTPFVVYSIQGEDNNDLQNFSFEEANSVATGRYLKVSFPASSDFYGRITVYRLEVYGSIVTVEGGRDTNQ